MDEVTRRKRKLADLLPPPPFHPSRLPLWMNSTSPQLPPILDHFDEMVVSKKMLLSCSFLAMLILPREGGAESKSRTWRRGRKCSLLRAWSDGRFVLWDPDVGYLLVDLGWN